MRGVLSIRTAQFRAVKQLFCKRCSGRLPISVWRERVSRVHLVGCPALGVLGWVAARTQPTIEPCYGLA